MKSHISYVVKVILIGLLLGLAYALVFGPPWA